MKRKTSLVRHITIFVLAQVAWLSLVTGWIYWYVSNYIAAEKVSELAPRQEVSHAANITILVVGLVLLIGLSLAMSLTFRNLNLSLNMTRFYDNFIASMTHELKSPLASIQIYLETMNSRNVSPGKQKEFIGLMKKDVDRLNGLINSILDISKLEQKKMAYNFSVHNSTTLLQAILVEILQKYQLPENTIKIAGIISCEIVADKAALQSVFNNLVDNSLKYSTNKVNINIVTFENRKNLVIKYADTGIGLPTKAQKKIFGKFFRYYNPQSPNVKGTGLGLYWVYEIIKLHGGQVSVYSKGPGTGTTFTIELPKYPSTKTKYVNNLLKLTQKWRQATGNSETKSAATKSPRLEENNMENTK